MKHGKTRRIGLGLLSAALCVPLALGTLAGCGGDGNEENKEPATSQSTVKDSEKISFTKLGETANTDPYAVNALGKEIEYLLSLDADRLLYNFRENAGLPTENAERYKGLGCWEDSLIAGHTMGHYLSALSQAYAGGGTSETDRKQLKERIDYLAEELKKCQDTTYDSARETGAKAGFLWGGNVKTHLSDVEYQFDNVENGKTNNVTEAWVPWYTMHKIVAGLLDLYENAGSETAFTVAKRLGDWVYDRASGWTDAKRSVVLNTEYGGMNDCMYRLYTLTKDERYAIAAHKFDEDVKTSSFTPSLVDVVLQDGEASYLTGIHANTTLPKIIGLLNGYISVKDAGIDGVDTYSYLEVAENFWRRVVEHHTYVTGGNSNDEHFVKDDRLNGSRTNINCETCNTYNMLKLSRLLFSVTKEKKYLDYYENTYINAILSSQNPETGMTMYFQPMASGYYKTYSTPEGDFWCCTGSGMESMSKLGDSIYYDAGNATYVAMYMSSTYKTDVVSLTMTADLENSDSVTIKADAGETVLRLRRPDWTTTFTVKVNENEISVADTDEFVSVEVHAGETVTVGLGKTVTIHNLPDAENVYAFKYGPYVLSAELGTENMVSATHGWGDSIEVPNKLEGLKESYNVSNGSLTDFRENIAKYMTRGADGKFTLTGIDGGPLTYSLHYKQYKQRYAIYFRFIGEEKEPSTGMETETVEAAIQPNRGQYETEAYFTDHGSEGPEGSRHATAGGYFLYWVGVDPSAMNYIVTNFSKADNGKSIRMSVGEQVIYEKTLDYTGGESLYEVMIPIPAAVAKEAVTNTLNGSEMPRVQVRIESAKAGEDSASVNTEFKTVKIKTAAGTVAYFVDCGDFGTSTLSDGDAFGLFNSVTEQVYGADPVFRGMNWGIWDDSSTVTAPTPEAGKGIGTNTTWAYEMGAGDGADKTATNRYTKNQYENGWQTMKLSYKFDLPNGKYQVKVYFTDPWTCSQNPSVAANGTTLKTGCAMDEEIVLEVTVTDGELLLDFTNSRNDSNQKCINLCYIQIIFA